MPSFAEFAFCHGADAEAVQNWLAVALPLAAAAHPPELELAAASIGESELRDPLRVRLSPMYLRRWMAQIKLAAGLRTDERRLAQRAWRTLEVDGRRYTVLCTTGATFGGELLVLTIVHIAAGPPPESARE